MTPLDKSVKKGLRVSDYNKVLDLHNPDEFELYEIKRLYRCVFYDMSDGVYREEMFLKEVERLLNRVALLSRYYGILDVINASRLHGTTNYEDKEYYHRMCNLLDDCYEKLKSINVDPYNNRSGRYDK